LTLDLDLAPVALYGEVEFFTGDASATQDATGTQLYVSADMAATEIVNVGAQFFYAAGDDTDKVYHILGNDFGGWDPLFALGTGLDNEQIGLGRPFGLFNDAGVVAIQLNGSVKATDDLTVSAAVSYAQAEDDKVLSQGADTVVTTDDVVDDNAISLALGVKYALLANTQLGLQIEYVDYENRNDEIGKAGVGLFVNF